MPANGYTIAHYAIIQQDKALLDSVLTHKYNCTEPSAVTTQHPNITPLQLAAMLGESEMLRMMLQSGIQPTVEHAVKDATKLSAECKRH